MRAATERHDFASDNTAAMCPEVLAALQEANAGAASSYGEDEWTKRARDSLREVFEIDCEVFFISNGTAANALALAQLAQSFHSVLCHENAHIFTDECGAPEFFSGGAKLLTIPGANGSAQRVPPLAGKIEIARAAAAIRREPELHAQKPRVISVTQPTELGAIYSEAELNALAEFARKNSLRVHMDGARFANAVAALNCAPKKISWQAGVDVLCLGGTKNGAAGAEVVIFFNRDLARAFDYRAKQAGQLASKMRFQAAQWLGLLREDVWLRNARHANHCAQSLAKKLEALGLRAIFPVAANAVFVNLPDKTAVNLQDRGWHFYKFMEPDIYRLMCSWMTTDQAILDFVEEVRTAT